MHECLGDCMGAWAVHNLHIGIQLSPPYSLPLATPGVATVSLKWGSFQLRYWLPVPVLGLQDASHLPHLHEDPVCLVPVPSYSV